MDQAFDAVDIYECTEVDDTGYDAFDYVADLQFAEAGLHVVFDGFLLGEDQLVVLAADIQDADAQRLVGQGVQLLQDLVLVGARYAWVVASGQL